MLKAGKIPIYEPGLAELVHRNSRDGRLTFTTDLAAGIAEAELVFIAVGTPQGDDGGANLERDLGRRPRDRREPQRPQDDHHQEHRAGRHQRRAGPADGRDHRRPLRRRQQPRVPQGRGGDRRLQQARPRRRRRPPARGLRAAHGPLPAVPPDRAAVPGDDAGIGRDDQVRRQLPAGDQDQLHQRDGQPLRAVPRRHQRRPPGDRPRPADRLQLPLPRRRLRRLLLPQGHPGRDPHGPGRRRPLADDGGRRRGQQRPEGRPRPEDPRPLRAATPRARPSPSGAWPSSPGPTTSARPRPWS